MGWPCGRLGAGGLHHPIAEFVDQAGILGERDEFRRRHHAAFGMPPAQQRLATAYLVAAEIDQRLIVDFEAAIDHRLAKILLHGEPGLGTGVHRRLEETVGAASLGLGAVHCEIGALDQLVELGAVLRRQRDADAGIGRQMMAETLIRLADRVVNPRHEFHHVGAVADGGLDHGKFVAAKPRDQISGLDAAPDPSCDGLQQLVADMVSERVVDALEFVDVDIEQGELFAADGVLQLALDLLAEQHPVGQVGERIVMREMRDLFVGVAAFGDVVDDIDDVAGFARGVADHEPLGGDVALALGLALPDMLILEQAVGGLQRLLLVGQDNVGTGLRKQVDCGPADDAVARNSELSLGDAVDQQVAAIVYVLHRDLRRNMIDDLAQEGLVAVAFLFEFAAFGDVFHGGDPTAMRQRLADRQVGASVGALHGALIDPADCDVLHHPGAEFVDVAGERSGVLAMLHQVAQLRSRLHDLGRQPVHVDIAAVEGDDAPGSVVHHQTLDHVVQRGVELTPLRLQPLLRFTALPGDLPDDQEQNNGDHHRRQRGGEDQESGLCAPVGQCGGDRVGRDDDSRKML